MKADPHPFQVDPPNMGRLRSTCHQLSHKAGKALLSPRASLSKRLEQARYHRQLPAASGGRHRLQEVTDLANKPKPCPWVEFMTCKFIGDFCVAREQRWSEYLMVVLH